MTLAALLESTDYQQLSPYMIIHDYHDGLMVFKIVNAYVNSAQLLSCLGDVPRLIVPEILRRSLRSFPGSIYTLIVPSRV